VGGERHRRSHPQCFGGGGGASPRQGRKGAAGGCYCCCFGKFFFLLLFYPPLPSFSWHHAVSRHALRAHSHPYGKNRTLVSLTILRCVCLRRRRHHALRTETLFLVCWSSEGVSIWTASIMACHTRYHHCRPILLWLGVDVKWASSTVSLVFWGLEFGRFNLSTLQSTNLGVTSLDPEQKTQI